LFWTVPTKTSDTDTLYYMFHPQSSSLTDLHRFTDMTVRKDIGFLLP